MSVQVPSSAPFVANGGLDPDDAFSSFRQDADGNLLINVAAGGSPGGGFSDQDSSNFTAGLSEFAPVGGARLDAPSDVANGKTAAARITPKRAVHANLRDNSGVEAGTLTSPIRIDPTGTTAQTVDLRDGSGNPITSTAGALDVAGSLTVIPQSSTTASAPSRQTIGGTAASILASNSSRKRCMIQNVGTTVLYLAFGATPTTTNFHLSLPAGGSAGDGTSPSYSDDLWKGAIEAISSAAGGFVQVVEMT